MKARDIMTSNVAIASGDDTIQDVARKMEQTDAGALPALPARSNDPLHTNSTARIVALLSPVIECAVIPGQPYRGGVIT